MLAVALLQFIPMAFAVGALQRRWHRIDVTIRLLAAGAAVSFMLNAANPARPFILISFVCGTAALARLLKTFGVHALLIRTAVLGCIANLAPMLVFGAMPVSISARERISPMPIGEHALIAAKHIEVEASGPIMWLGDVIAIPPLGAVVSIGDLLVYATLVAAGLGVRRAAVLANVSR